MPVILHDGPKQWNQFTARKKGADEDELANFLGTYFEQAHDQVTTIARDAWTDAIKSMFRDVSNGYSTLETLYDMRRKANYQSEPNTPPAAPKTIFILHQRHDLGRAKMIGKQIVKHGEFDVWLDIWDPTFETFKELDPSPAKICGMTSLMIEIGLINSCATIALLSAPPTSEEWLTHTYSRAAASSVIPPKMLGYLFANAIDDHPNCIHFDDCIMHRDGSARNPELNAWLDKLS